MPANLHRRVSKKSADTDGPDGGALKRGMRRHRMAPGRHSRRLIAHQPQAVRMTRWPQPLSVAVVLGEDLFRRGFMPFIRIDMFPGRSIEQKRELAEVLTREVARIANCRPETINFIFTDVERENWGRNGNLFCDSYEYENDPD